MGGRRPYLGLYYTNRQLKNEIDEELLPYLCQKIRTIEKALQGYHRQDPIRHPLLTMDLTGVATEPNRHVTVTTHGKGDVVRTSSNWFPFRSYRSFFRTLLRLEIPSMTLVPLIISQNVDTHGTSLLESDDTIQDMVKKLDWSPEERHVAFKVGRCLYVLPCAMVKALSRSSPGHTSSTKLQKIRVEDDKGALAFTRSEEPKLPDRMG